MLYALSIKCLFSFFKLGPSHASCRDTPDFFAQHLQYYMLTMMWRLCHLTHFSRWPLRFPLLMKFALNNSNAEEPRCQLSLRGDE
jgi:hypothetical protein